MKTAYRLISRPKLDGVRWSHGRARMRQIALLAGVALIAHGGVGGRPAVAADSTTASVGRNFVRLRQAAEAAQKGDCKTVLERAASIIDQRKDTGLPPELLSLTYDIVVNCEIEQGLEERALRHALTGTGIGSGSDYLWHMRLGLQLEAKQHEAAVQTIEAMSRGRGAALNSASRHWVAALHRALSEAGKEEMRTRLLKVLSSAAYSPGSDYEPPDYYRLEYAIALSADGDAEAARAVIAMIREPRQLVEASLDGRVRQLVPADLDLRAAAEAMLAIRKEEAARHPERLRPLILAAEDLRLLGRPKEAVELLQTVAGRLDDHSAFEDRSESINWWWDELGRAHSALGHYEEAVAAFSKGAALQESDSLNVSQVINLAHVHNRFGRGEEALKTLAVFEDPKRSVSPYGAMTMRLARGCAQVLAGRPEAVEADLAYMKEHEKDHPAALTDLLLCLGDLEGAAASVIRRLEDPERRVDALLQLSDYAEPPVAFPHDPIMRQLKVLKQRPDVKAAIDRAGGIRRFELQRAGI